MKNRTMAHTREQVKRALLLLKEDFSDLSQEGYLALTAMLLDVWVAETIAYQMSEALEALGAKGTLVQQKKLYLNSARRKVEGMCKDLEHAFDGTFEKAFTLVKGEEMKRGEIIQELAAFILGLEIVALTRDDGSDEKLASMIKAIRNFKQDSELDTDALLRFFKLQ